MRSAIPPDVQVVIITGASDGIGAEMARQLAQRHGAKLGLVELVDRSNLTPEQRHRTLNAMAALWGGASINNLLILLSAQPPVAMLAGVAGGLWMWRRHGAPEAPDAVVAHVPWPNASGE